MSTAESYSNIYSDTYKKDETLMHLCAKVNHPVSDGHIGLVIVQCILKSMVIPLSHFIFCSY